MGKACDCLREEKQIAKGHSWVRVDRNGKKAGQKGYGDWKQSPSSVQQAEG